MQETEKYLNGILQKRLGSLINYNSTAKNATTVTRLPRKQQKLESMPTVFRKKQQTIVRLPAPSVYRSQYQTQLANNQFQEQQPTQSQRVEYMLISKRIDTLKDSQAKPVVDVSRYKEQSKYVLPGMKDFYRKQTVIPQLREEENDNIGQQINPNMQGSLRIKHRDVSLSEPRPVEIGTNPKRRKIFGNKRQIPSLQDS